jgi:2-polyprenyl-3-methyl-5-hydroxy-6-metoxy-1,4-benzoquinol methylase
MALYQETNLNNEGNLENVLCNLCGSDAYKILFTSTLTDDDFKCGNAQYSISEKSPGCGQIVQCNQCGLVYVNPREKFQDIIYSYGMVKDEGYLKERKARDATFLRGLRFLEKYCPQKGSLLDIGCFTGLFLNLARNHGWSVLGIEPSQWAARYAKEKLDLNVLEGAIEDSQFSDDSFDAVSMWDVIEHLPDPKSTLATLHAKLKTKGVLFLNTFNYDSIFRKLFGRKYWFIERMHIYYFTSRTITKILETCNYEVLRIIPHFKTLSLGYYIRRLKDVSERTAAVINPLSSLFMLNDCDITVYVGQMTIIARKKG